MSVMLIMTLVDIENSSVFAVERQLKTLSVRVSPFLSWGPFYIAKEEGYFEKQGLDIRFIQFNNNSESMTALLTGDLDVDAILTVGLLNVIARGQSVKIVANKGFAATDECPADGFVVRSGLVEKMQNPAPEMLQDLKFHVMPTWVDRYFLDQVLSKWGLGISKIMTTPVTNSAARLAALNSANLDVAFFSEPWITRLRESGAGDLWLPLSAIIPNFPMGVITFGPNLLEKDQSGDLGVRFLHAYLQGIAQFKEGKTPRNIEILAAATKLEPALLARVCWPSFADNGQSDAELLSRYSEWATEQGMVDRALRPEELYEPRFIEQAATELGR